LKDEEAMDWCKWISRLSLDKGNKLKGGHGGSPRRRVVCVCGKARRRRMSVRKTGFLVLMCVRIKHGRNLCSKCLYQTLVANFWTFGSLVIYLKSTVGFVSKLNQT
jgi:hypothetical protein